ncbi:MAG: ANL family adenylate-forming protein [Steroidobacteraceae bacterium]
MRLWESIATAEGVPLGSLHAVEASVELAALVGGSSLGGRLEELRGRSLLVATHRPLAAALACIELDGVVRRLVLCPLGVAREYLPGIIENAGIDACVRDDAGLDTKGLGIPLCVTQAPVIGGQITRRCSHDTEWVLLTSGTTGAPKLVLHTFAGLSSAIAQSGQAAEDLVWATFYDIRRYGGLQIFLRALRAGSLVLSSPEESVPDFLARAAARHVTHISGTPSHWRRALMSGAAASIAPRYVRLSGEIADQAILDQLRSTYPKAQVAHAFATTEAGVAFEVGDGLCGFPASLLEAAGLPVEMRVTRDTLRIRSGGNAIRYLGEGAPPLKGEDGFVDTGDRLELRSGRYHFVGRSGGVINVGGLKVHPEEVEASINSHPWVRMSLVRSRRNPITGALVTADVVLLDPSLGEPDRPEKKALTQEILEACRRTLEPYKVPATIRFVPALEVSPSGKLVRPHA